jgi:hypothetical protein
MSSSDISSLRFTSCYSQCNVVRFVFGGRGGRERGGGGGGVTRERFMTESRREHGSFFVYAMELVT